MEIAAVAVRMGKALPNHCLLSLDIIDEAVDTDAILTSSNSDDEIVVADDLDCSNKDDTHPLSRGGKTRFCVDESEMRRVFDRFDQDADGLISDEELRRYMKCCCGKAMSDAETYSMILSVDSSHNGAIDFKDFLSLYQSHFSDEATGEEDSIEGDDEEALFEAFSVFDKDHDGFISPQELQIVLLNLGVPEGKSLTSCEIMIRKVDRDGKGFCDLLHFHKMMSRQLSKR